MRSHGLATLAIVALLASSPRAEDPGEAAMMSKSAAHHAAGAEAPVVTEATIFANERFWPYQVGLADSHDGALGVLIRVEAEGLARIDFGRDGLREVPIADTDLVARANRVRSGELEKMAPNFVLALGPRLVDPSGDALRPVPYPAVAENAGFLCVFADPASKEFAALATALTPLQDHRGVGTVLFPQGDVPDAELRDQLRALKWPVAFVYGHLAEAYTRSLLAEGVKLPFVMLQTREGRVLYQSTWKAGAETGLRAALDEHFEAAVARSAIAATPLALSRTPRAR